MKKFSGAFFSLALTGTNAFLVYFLLGLGMILEGEIFLMVAGSLVQLRILELKWVLAAVFSGALIGDFLWYWIGRRYGAGLSFFGRFGRGSI